MRPGGCHPQGGRDDKWTSFRSHFLLWRHLAPTLPLSTPGQAEAGARRAPSTSVPSSLPPLLPCVSPSDSEFRADKQKQAQSTDRRLGATSCASCFPGTDQVWLYQKEPPTQAQHSCLLWREKREESPEKQACHSTGRERVKLHQEISCINPLNATWLAGGLSQHLGTEPPSNPLRTGWASRTLISKHTHHWRWEKRPHPQQKRPPASGAHRDIPHLPSVQRDQQGQGWPQQEGFLTPAPAPSAQGTQVSGRQRTPGLPFLSNESHPSLQASNPGRYSIIPKFSVRK